MAQKFHHDRPVRPIQPWELSRPRFPIRRYGLPASAIRPVVLRILGFWFLGLSMIGAINSVYHGMDAVLLLGSGLLGWVGVFLIRRSIYGP